jgi:hypothetical protein
MIKKCLIMLGFVTICTISLFGQKEKIQSVFIYNFITKYIEWPASAKNGDFIIGVLGSSPIVAELEELAYNRNVGNQKITIKTFRSAEDVTQCHVLYITESKTVEMEKALAKVGSTLIITDNAPSGTKGDAINFITVSGKQRFGVKAYNAINKGLVVSPELGKLVTGNS